MSDTEVWTESAPALGLTIKYGKGYEEPWLTVRGTAEQIKQEVIGYFGLNPEDQVDLTTHEVVLNAKSLALKTSNAAGTLGGTVISGDTRTSGGGGWARAAQSSEPAQPERNPLYAKIEGETQVQALKELFARNKAAFDADPELMAAWRAKGKELTEK